MHNLNYFNNMFRTTVAIGGFSSEIGKTTLLCQLLGAFPGWEAIKLTRGHFRSCGKDPHACCVSHLLSDEPIVRSGWEQTYSPGKDTGRYWEAGASNVHWVIVTDSQVSQGIMQALNRVQSHGVLIEGNSFLRYLEVDFAIMVARLNDSKIKPTARRALEKTSALFFFEDGENAATVCERIAMLPESSPLPGLIKAIPVYTSDELPQLIARLEQISKSVTIKS
jgi:molybdopterin-guanine dinucleotide biosynthesis protein